MKIALVLPDFPGGGAERVFSTLAKEFVRRSHEVDLVIANNDNPAYMHLIPSQVRIVDLNASRMRRSFFSLTRYFHRYQPDVAMASRPHCCCFVVLAKIVSGAKTAVVLREANTPSIDLKQYPLPRRWLLGSFIRILYPFADALICVSQGAVNDAKKFIRFVDRKVHLIYNPVLTEDLFADAAKVCAHPWFTQKTRPVILGVGRLSSQKRFDILIKAFAIVRKHRNARLLILGEGEDRAELETLVKNLHLQEDVSLPGFDPNPFKYMARANLFVLSSAWEGSPGALIQALACGCPVVSTDCPSGPKEILQAGRLGRLVPVDNVDSLAMAIEEALDREPPRAEQADIVEYTVERAVDSYLNVFSALTKE